MKKHVESWLEKLLQIAKKGEKKTPEVTPVATPKVVKKAPAGKTYKVTGIEHYMGAIMDMAVENEDYSLSKRGLIDEGLIEERVWRYDFDTNRVELVPEPTNPHDPNAIRVLVDGAHVGYIKAGSCAHLLKVIREGRLGPISCEMGGGPYKYIVEDVSEDGREVYTLDTGNVPYFVHLSIIEK